jgi:hypothetical protein
MINTTAYLEINFIYNIDVNPMVYHMLYAVSFFFLKKKHTNKQTKTKKEIK